MMNVGTWVKSSIDKIENESSTKTKLSILKEMFEDETRGEQAKRIFMYCYNPEKMYGTKWVPDINVNVGAADDISSVHVWSTLDKLTSREITGNDAGVKISEVLGTLDANSREILRRIIHKDMRCGVNVSTINKACPGLVPETEYMRCCLPDKNLDKWKWADGIYVQLKADGMFVSARRDGDHIEIMSRSGEIFPDSKCLTGIRDQVFSILADKSSLDGEFLVVKEYSDAGEPIYHDRATGNGILNSVRQGADIDEEIHYHVWDERRKGVKYQERFLDLEYKVNGILQAKKYVFMIPSYIVVSKTEAFKIARQWMTDGLEGAVIKNPAGLWKDGTSKDQVKLKCEFDCDVIITGFVPGKKGTKYEKTFGSLTYKSSDGKVTGSVAGFTAADHENIWKNIDEWISGNVIVTLKGNALTIARDSDTWAISHPRFVERRHDKTEADDYEKILASFENYGF